jgi:Flp pilus assembly protein TadG
MVEFGLVAPALVGVLLGAVEMGLQAAVSVALDNAALRASRTGSLGRLNTDGTRAGAALHACVLKAAREAGGGLLNGDLQLVMTNYGSSATAGADPNRTNGTGSSGAGAGGRTVVYELTYKQPYVLMGRLFGQTLTHTAFVTTQNEPFANAGQSTAASC